MTTRTKLAAALSLVCVADLVIPVPILGFIMLYVVLDRPAWFPKLMRSVYEAHDGAA